MLTWFRPLVQWPVPLDRTSVSCLWTSRLVTDIRRFVEHGISTAQSIGYSDKVYPCEEDVARESNMRCLNELSNRSTGSSSSSSSQVTQAGGKFETSLTSTFLELCRRSKQVLLTSKPPSIPFICDGIVLGEKRKNGEKEREVERGRERDRETLWMSIWEIEKIRKKKKKGKKRKNGKDTKVQMCEKKRERKRRNITDAFFERVFYTG